MCKVRHYWERGSLTPSRYFVLPPSKRKLEQRLRDRSADGTEEIRRRLGEASREIAHYGSYDYILVNEEVADTVARLRAILTGRAEQDGET